MTNFVDYEKSHFLGLRLLQTPFVTTKTLTHGVKVLLVAHYFTTNGNTTTTTAERRIPTMHGESQRKLQTMLNRLEAMTLDFMAY